MKLNVYISCLLFLFALTTRTLADARFDLKEPELAFPQGFPESNRTNILASLKRSDCKFLGGSFINSFTSLNYGGDTRALNLFLSGLVNCPGVTLSVRFASERIPEDCDWQVTHMAGEPAKLMVGINLQSSRIKLDALVIPESKGPPLTEAKK
jgi:hypothetical protein